MFVLVCLIALVQWDTGKIDPAEELPVIETLEDEQTEEIIAAETVQETVPGMVVRISREIGLDPGIALALLKEENDKYDANAISPENHNGSRDLGLFQISDKYLVWYIQMYWKSDKDFQWNNAYHNTVVALRHLQRLLNISGNDIKSAAIMYNAGENWHLKNKTPSESSIKYGDRVYENYRSGLGR
jgi:hypothetical protein